MTMKIIADDFIEACSGGQWGGVLNSAAQAVVPVTCSCVAEKSGRPPIFGGTFMRAVAVKQCFKSCCIKIRKKHPSITHFVTEDASGEEYIGEC